MTPDSPFRSLLKSRKLQELSSVKQPPPRRPHHNANVGGAIELAKTQESLCGGGDPTARRHQLLKAAMKVAGLSRPSSFRLSTRRDNSKKSSVDVGDYGHGDGGSDSNASTNGAGNAKSTGPSNGPNAVVVNVSPVVDGHAQETNKRDMTGDESKSNNTAHTGSGGGGGAFAKPKPASGASSSSSGGQRGSDKLVDPIQYVEQLADSEVVEICAYVTGYDTTYGS